jgi:hypothetical protein
MGKVGRKDYPKDMTRTASSLLLFDFDCRSSMRTLKTHFEQVPVEIVKKIAEPFAEDEEVETDGTSVELPHDALAAEQDWREVARRIQVETDPYKMMEMAERLLEKFDEEKRRKGPQRCAG